MYAASTLFLTMWASAAATTSRGWSVSSAAQSRKDDRKPCGTAAIRCFMSSRRIRFPSTGIPRSFRNTIRHVWSWPLNTTCPASSAWAARAGSTGAGSTGHSAKRTSASARSARRKCSCGAALAGLRTLAHPPPALAADRAGGGWTASTRAASTASAHTLPPRSPMISTLPENPAPKRPPWAVPARSGHRKTDRHPRFSLSAVFVFPSAASLSSCFCGPRTPTAAILRPHSAVLYGHTPDHGKPTLTGLPVGKLGQSGTE